MKKLTPYALIAPYLLHVAVFVLFPVVFSVVLTPLHFHEHDDHQQFFASHFVTKGKEAARACVQTLESLRAIEA